MLCCATKGPFYPYRHILMSGTPAQIQNNSASFRIASGSQKYKGFLTKKKKEKE